MRQENFKEISGFPVIPAEAGEILYHDTVYFAGLDILYHLKKSRSLKIHAGPSTINILRRQYQIRMVGGVISQYSQLRLDTVFFWVVQTIAEGQTGIDGSTVYCGKRFRLCICKLLDLF